MHIDIIDGQEEAKIIYNNHVEHMEDQKGNYMYVDVGGGSTEINLLSEGQLVCSRSYNIGTVRMLNNAVKDSEWERLKNDLAELAKSYPQTNIIGSGGNINKLYRLADKKNKKKMTMQVSVLQELHTRLKALSLEERMEQFGMKPDRADVIIPAGEIFLTIANIIGASYIHVPVIGLSDGIIDELTCKTKTINLPEADRHKMRWITPHFFIDHSLISFLIYFLQQFVYRSLQLCIFSLDNCFRGIQHVDIRIEFCILQVASIRQTVTYYRNTEHQCRILHSHPVYTGHCSRNRCSDQLA